MKAYHGTDNDFSKFNASLAGLHTDGNATDEYWAETARLGFWFAEDRERLTEAYDKVMECELSIENPFHVDSVESLANWFECTCQNAEDLRTWCIDNGHDGIVVDNDEDFDCVSYVAFRPEQISIIK